MAEATIEVDDALFVSVGDGTRQRLEPQESPIIFGRGSDADIHLCPATRTSVSRQAGSFLRHDGLWWVQNRSKVHALYVVLADDTPEPLPVRNGDRIASRVISPPGLVLRVLTPEGHIELTVVTARLPPDPTLTLSDGEDDDDPTTPRHALSPRSRFLLAAKFLAEGPAGAILGDREAATLINGRRGDVRDPVTEPAVMAAAKKARDLLESHGVPVPKGPAGTPQLRRELLAWGYLTEADARWIRRPS